MNACVHRWKLACFFSCWSHCSKEESEREREREGKSRVERNANTHARTPKYAVNIYIIFWHPFSEEMVFNEFSYFQNAPIKIQFIDSLTQILSIWFECWYRNRMRTNNQGTCRHKFGVSVTWILNVFEIIQVFPDSYAKKKNSEFKRLWTQAFEKERVFCCKYQISGSGQNMWIERFSFYTPN